MDPVLKSKVVSVELLKANRASPIIASFQNGIFKKVDQVIAKRVEDQVNDTKYALVATPDSVYKSDLTNAGSKSVDTFLAIRNKRTNEMRLVQVQESSFKHTLYDSKHSIYENNIVDAKKALHKEFGGKKALANYERVKKTAPNVEVLEETLERQLYSIDDKAFEADIFDLSQQEREKFQSSIFPEIDTSSGSSVRDVFTARKLLGENMLEHLSDLAIQVLQADPKSIPLANKYLRTTVAALQMKKKPDASENIERVAMLLYIDALIRLINCKKRNLDQAELSPISDHVERDVRKKFSIQGNMSNSKFTKQKSIIYYLILLLISTDKLQIELEDALEGVDLTKTELIKYATVIGAKVLDKTKLVIQRVNLNADSRLSAPIPSAKRTRRK